MENKTEITAEDVKAWKAELEKAGIAARACGIGGHTLPVGYVGGGLYRIADGILCTERGYKEFQKKLMEWGMGGIKVSRKDKHYHRKVKRTIDGKTKKVYW